MNNREERHTVTAVAAPSIREFLLWLLDARDATVRAVGTDEFAVEFTESWAELLGRGQSRFVLPREATADAVQALVPLIRRLSLSGDPLHAWPKQQPEEADDLSAAVLGRFDVDGGRAEWRSTRLELRPVLRLTFLGDNSDEVLHRFFDATGEPLAEELVSGLRLEELQARGEPPERDWSRDRLQDWIQESQRRLTDEVPAAGTFLAATIVWCRYLRGHMQFVIGDNSASLDIEGWAQLLADGLQRPAPFVCPQTGQSSYRLVAADDGTVTADAAVAICACSRSRVLSTRLVLCTETGVRALPEFLTPCAITGEPVLSPVLQTCLLCRQRARQLVMQDGFCQSCRSLRSVGKDDPRIARLLGQYPRLDRFRRWSVAESAQNYVLTARTFGKYVLLVVRKEGLAPLRVAVRRRWFRGAWHDVAVEEYPQWLGEV